MAHSFQYADNSRRQRESVTGKGPTISAMAVPDEMSDGEVPLLSRRDKYGEQSGTHWQRKKAHYLIQEAEILQDDHFLLEDEFENTDGRYVPRGWIQHDTYNQIRNKFGEEGVQKFVDAMNKGVFVRADGQPGIKRFPGKGYCVDGSIRKYKYEIKVVHRQYGNYRVYGNYDPQTGYIIFDKFCEARGHTKKKK